jgi:hypothetical protein
MGNQRGIVKCNFRTFWDYLQYQSLTSLSKVNTSTKTKKKILTLTYRNAFNTNDYYFTEIQKDCIY